MLEFKHVRTGIMFVHIGLVLIVLAIIAVPLGVVLQAAPLLLAVPLLTIASSLLSMIGRILCLSVPKEVGASGLIYAAVVCDVSSLLAVVSEMVPGLPNLSGFSRLLGVAAIIFFLIFLKKLALYVGDSDSAVRASNLLNLGIGLVVMMIATIVLPLASLQAFMYVPALLAFILMVVGFFIYNRLLSGVRTSLPSARSTSSLW